MQQSLGNEEIFDSLNYDKELNGICSYLRKMKDSIDGTRKEITDVRKECADTLTSAKQIAAQNKAQL